MDPLTALAELQRNGIGGFTCGPYVSVDPANVAHMQAAIYLLGGVSISINVTQRMMDQFNANQPWDTTSDDSDVLGGHEVCSTIYAPDGMDTWGRVEPAPNVPKDEVYAILWPGWETNPKIVQLGLDVPKLTADLQAVTG